MKWKKTLNNLKLNTLQRRLLLVLTTGVVLCLLFLAFFSYSTMKVMEENRLNPAITSDLRQISDQMEMEYMTLIQISQQMVPQGSVGSSVSEYLESSDQFDRIMLSKEISESISLLTFTNQRVELVMYFDQEKEPMSTLFQNLVPRNTFSIDDMPVLSQTNEITYYGMHRAQSRFTNDPVISVTRPVSFPNGMEMTIYAESRTTASHVLKNLSQLQKVPYTFLQVDPDNRIQYSSSPDWQLGQKVTFENASNKDGSMGKIGDYIWVKQEMQFGSSNVILMPEKSYSREINFWKGGLVIVVLMTAMVILVITVLLIKWIYHPIQILNEEIELLGSGNLNVSDHHFSLQEFDHLFHRFNLMKKQISLLVTNVGDQEREKKQLELDKLYYQINPHFLMNSLNSVHWMAMIQGQTEIGTFISQLNYILGYSLGKIIRDATLRTEIKLLENYLELQKTRYDFQSSFDIEEGEYLDKPTARLILQPLAENAVCHNMDEFGNLWVIIRLTDQQMIHIVLKDDGRGFEIAPDDQPETSDNGQVTQKGRMNKGIGLQYVQKNLQSFYGDRAQMKIESELGKGTVVTIDIPVTDEK